MCGRYVEIFEFIKVVKEFSHIIKQDDFGKLNYHNFNTSPTEQVHVILNTTPPSLAEVKWGLIPPWEKPPFKKGLHNVRSEGILKPWTQKPIYGNMLQKSIRERRCIFIMAGFYEWEKTEPPKQPWFIFDKERPVFGVAGIYRTVVDTDTGEEIVSAAMITQPANDLLKAVKHDRMPMILKKEVYMDWLSEDTSAAIISQMIKQQYPAKSMNAYPVGKIGRQNTLDNIWPIGDTVYPMEEVKLKSRLQLEGMGGRRRDRPGLFDDLD